MWFVAAVAFGAAASDPLTVCITPDAGLNLLEGRGSLSRITSDQQVQGFDVGMRNEILTRRLQQPYNVRALGSYAELQVRTRLGECDIGWGMFHRTLSRERCTSSCPNVTASMFASMTEDFMWEEQDASVFEPFRCCADYSAPPMKWATSVMYRAPGSSNFFLSIFQLLAEPFFINFLSFIFLWIVIFAHAVWLAERRNNADEFPAHYLAGIDDAVWWAAVTISTVGYGDKSPKSPIGRLIALLLILFGLAMFSVLAGHMAGRFVELSDAADVKSASDVQNWRLCGYAEAFEAVKSVYVVRTIRSHIWECGELLRTGQVDGMLMDQPAMAYYRAHNDWAISTPLVISPPLAEPTVGIIFPKDSPLRSAVSAEIVDYVGSRDHEESVLAWFPDMLSDNLSNLQLSLVVPFVCLVGLYVAMQVLFTIKGKASFLPAVQRAFSPFALL